MHRRSFFRAPTWLVVGDERMPANAVNVSVGGAAVRVGSNARVGELVRLEAELGSVTVALDAEVVRSGGGVLGLRFLALGQRALEALLEASGFAEREPEEDDPSGVRHV